MNNLSDRLYQEIIRIPLIDPHSHIDPRNPASKSIDDLLGYHYYTELAHSAGMDKSLLDTGADPRDRVKGIAGYLPALANTVQYSWLLEIARTLLDFPESRIDGKNWELLWDCAARKMSSPGWEEEVLARSNLQKVFLTSQFDDPLEGFNTHRYIPCLRLDDLVFQLHQPGMLERLQASTGRDVKDTKGLEEALEAVFTRFQAKGARACAISLPPDFIPAREASGPAQASLSKILSGRTGPEDRERVSRHVFWILAEIASNAGLPFDLMIGVNRNIYTAGVPQGTDLFDRRCSLIQYKELFNAFPRLVFPVSVLAQDQNPELVAYAWIFPNVFTSGHWWYSNIPAFISSDVRARLQGVPKVKQIAYYSDMYKLEFGLPKFNMYRRVLASVLAEDYVIARGASEEEALDLARTIIRDNVERIFRLEAPAGGISAS